MIKCVPSVDKPDGCYLAKLDDSLDDSPDAAILSELREIDNQLALKLTLALNDIRADVWPALLLLNEERDKYNREKTKG